MFILALDNCVLAELAKRSLRKFGMMIATDLYKNFRMVLV